MLNAFVALRFETGTTLFLNMYDMGLDGATFDATRARSRAPSVSFSFSLGCLLPRPSLSFSCSLVLALGRALVLGRAGGAAVLGLGTRCRAPASVAGP